LRTDAAGGGTQAERPAAENIDTILRLEKQDEEMLAVHHRLFHWVGWFVGTARFIVLQCVSVLSRVVLNHAFPHHASTNIRSLCSRPPLRSKPFS
jgi:uncharacterized membrane protein